MSDPRGNFIAEWVRQESGEDYDDPESVAEESPEEVPLPVAGSRRSQRTADKVRAVIAEATGQDPDDLDIDFRDMDAAMAVVSDVVNNDLTDPQSAWQALDVALNAQRYEEVPATDEEVRQAQRTVDRIERVRRQAKAGESDGAWRVRDGNWREEHGMPRKKKKPSPSRSPERRRQERMRAKARQLGISIEEAEALTPRLTPEVYEHLYGKPVRHASDTNPPVEVSPHGNHHRPTLS